MYPKIGLLTLDLSLNELGPEGLPVLSEWLESYPGLRLNIALNYVKSDHLRDPALGGPKAYG